jgi:hypothetical protein
MSSTAEPEVTPRRRIEALCADRGTHAVVSGCVALLGGDRSDRQLIISLGGSSARQILLGNSRADEMLWLRVWATRGLLWAWDGTAIDALRGALLDEAWRVREMAAKAVARHLVGGLVNDVANLREDPVGRVRYAAERAVTRLAIARA